MKDKKVLQKANTVSQFETLKEMLAQSVKNHGDRPAFLVKKEKGGTYEEIKYKQLANDVNALGTALFDLGLKGEKIAIIGENSYEWIVTYLAVVNGLGIVVPLDKELGKDEIWNLLEMSKSKAVFYTDTYKEILKDNPIDLKVSIKVYGDRTDLSEKLELDERENGLETWNNLIIKGEDLIAQGKLDYVEAKVNPEVMNMLYYSSGTTGVAKGIMLCHRNLVSNLRDTDKVVKVYPEDRTLSLLPIHHTFENTLGILFILSRGASAAFCEGLRHVSKNFVEAQASILVGVPLIFESIYTKIWKQAEKSKMDKTLRTGIKISRFLKAFGIRVERKLFKTIHDSFGGKLRMIVCGAAAVDPKVVIGFEDFGVSFLQGYGLTECSPLVSGTPEHSNRRKKPNSVGPVVASGQLKIVDKDEDGIGEVVYKGPNLMLGYYEMEDETNDVIKDGWFYTGDLGYLDKKGWLYLTGRKKNVIVTKTGKNIYPEEIELFVNENKYVKESMVYGIENDQETGTTIGIQIHPSYDIIYEEFGAEFEDNKIQNLIKDMVAKINEKLPIYKRIQSIIIRKDEFIKTTTKKIQRHKNIKKD